MPIKVDEKNKQLLNQMANPSKPIIEDSVEDFERRYTGMANPEFNNNFIGLLRTRTTTIYISTNEEKRLLTYIYNVCKARGYEAFEWDCFRLMRKLLTTEKVVSQGNHDFRYPDPTLAFIIEELEKKRSKQEKGNGAIYVLCDFYRYLQPNQLSPVIERQIKLINRITTNCHVIMTGPSYINTPALEKDVAVLDFPFPNEEEIKSTLFDLVKSEKVQTGFPGISEFAKANQEELINAARGLTITEASQAYSKSIVMSKQLNLKPFDINMILQEKKQIIKKTDILEYVDSNIDINDIGGLDDLVHWLNIRKLASKKDAAAYGLKKPRGVLLLGMPGCGKSLTAKAVATLYEEPLLRLDFGKMFNSLVGESEKIARHAIKLAETIAPCVSGDSIIYDDKGISYRIEDIVSKNVLSSGESLYTYSLNEKTWKLEKTKVQAVIKHSEKKKMLRIDSSAGSITVTEDHRMMVNRNGSLVWIPANQLKKDDLLMTPKSLPRVQKNMDISDVFPEKNSKTISTRIRSKMHTVNMSGSVLDLEELAVICGFIDAKGSVNEITGDIVFCGKDVKITHALASSLSEVFLTEPEVNGVNLHLTNQIVAKCITHFLKNIGQQSEMLLCYYLSGYYHAAGKMSFIRYTKPEEENRSRAYINFETLTQASNERLKQTLNNIGIVSYSVEAENQIILDIEHIEMFLALVPMIENRSFEHFLTQAKLHNEDQMEIFGYNLGDSISSFKKKYNIDLLEYQGASLDNSSFMQLSKVQKLTSFLKTNLEIKDDNFTKLIESDVVGVKVIKIRDAGMHYAYDLACEKNHNFFANGLLCHNCVLWADEIEKGLAGGVGAGSGDSGTTKRVIGTFLTWLQEKEAPVFVICTANNVQDIPPEFMRAGRFDEVFFVDLPTLTGRKQVFEVLLRKYKFDPKNFDINQLAASSEGFSGAEIEKAIESAMFECFCDGKRPITTKDLVYCCMNISPLSKTRAEEFSVMRKWAEGRCKMANTKDSLSEKESSKEETNDLDI